MASIVSLLHAQPTPPALPPGIDLSKPVSLVDCVRIALAVNPGLAIASNDVRAAAAGVTQASSAWLPALSFDANAAAAKRPGMTGAGGASGAGGGGSTTSWGTDLALSQTLYRTGLSEEIRSARAKFRASQFQREDTRRALVLKVAQAYYAALAARALVDVAGRALESSMQHVALVQAQIAQDAAARADLYPFEVELAQARLAVIAAENRAQTALTSLKEAIGLPAGSSLQLADQLTRPPLTESLSELLQIAYRDRPDIRSQMALVESARLNLRIAELQRGPVLDVGGNVSYGLGSGATGTAGQIQASVSVPLFDGNLTKARATAAQTALESAKQALQQLQIAVGAEVELNYLNAVEANNRIDAAETSVRAAQVNLEAAETKYAEAVGTVIEVTDAQVSLRQAEVERVQAYYDYNTALAALRAATGQLAVPGVE